MKNIAIITGASAGLGKEFTKQVSALNLYDEIWIIARRADRLQEVSNQINTEKGKELIKPLAMDLSSSVGVPQLKEKLEKEAESTEDFSVGLLINNAGFGTYGPFEQTSVNRSMEMVDLNCTSLTGICGIALPYLKKGSLIINTASLAAFMPLGNFAAYAASKAYVLSFSVALAAELKEKGIKVCALCPGSVSTEFANVASNGARKEVKGGHDPVKVVTHCLKKAYKGKKIVLWHPKWKFNAFLSRIVGRYFVAKITYKHNPRPHNPDTN